MRKLSELPSPATCGLLGHVSYLKKDNVHQQMLAWRNECGPLYRLRVGAKFALAVTDVEIIKTILKARPDEFRRISNIESVFDEVGMNGVFSSEGERWKYQREIVEQAFLPNHLKGFHASMQAITGRLQQRFDALANGSEQVFLVDEFKRYTVDITSLLAFGEDVNVIERGENSLSASLREIFPVISQRCRSPFPLWRFCKTAQDKAFDVGLSNIKQHIEGFIAHQRQRLRDNTALASAPENTMQVMLQMQNKEGRLTDKDVIANAVTLLLAGEDTTANTLAWMVYLICQRPDVENKLVLELAQCTGLADEPLTWPIPKMPWLTAIMYEAMRLKPVAPQLYLEPLHDTVVGDVWVKKGTPLFLTLHAGGFDARYFKEPGQFFPERWVARDGASFSNMLPFGGGSRMCPGRALAIAEIKMAMHALYGRYRVTALQHPEAVRERFAFTVSPEHFKVVIGRR
ncbi:cytochrome P450 [Serratia rubidaea]|uniref:cytochrome P450 n=1 Tax=Serratia rubidaea TaxID=61652 RepID=UPI00234A5C5C|nr:cytochrome P450 [Serratia rubidaea]MDC6109296.1 cytochrome P450 [Serratia rubidaea]